MTNRNNIIEFVIFLCYSKVLSYPLPYKQLKHQPFTFQRYKPIMTGWRDIQSIWWDPCKGD